MNVKYINRTNVLDKMILKLKYCFYSYNIPNGEASPGTL